MFADERTQRFGDMSVKRLNGDTVWVACPAFGDVRKTVVGTVRSVVLREIGSTERRFEFGKKAGSEVSEVRGNAGVWIVFETDLLKVTGVGRKKGTRVGVSKGEDYGASEF